MIKEEVDSTPCRPGLSTTRPGHEGAHPVSQRSWSHPSLGHVPKHLRDQKAKGEWAEMVFMAKATGLGFIVCKPYGDNRAFDFMIRAAGRTSCVQVKSVWVPTKSAYHIRTSHLVLQRRSRPRRITRTYRSHEIDFIVGFVVPENAWYVIPVAAVRHAANIAVFACNRRSRGKYERFREAWHLLAEADAGNRRMARRRRGAKLGRPPGKGT